MPLVREQVAPSVRDGTAVFDTDPALLVGIEPLHNLCRDARDHAVIRHVVGDNGVAGDHSDAADLDLAHDPRAGSDPRAALDDDRAVRDERLANDGNGYILITVAAVGDQDPFHNVGIVFYHDPVRSGDIAEASDDAVIANLDGRRKNAFATPVTVNRINPGMGPNIGALTDADVLRIGEIDPGIDV